MSGNDNPFGAPASGKSNEAEDDSVFSIDLPEGEDEFRIPAADYPAYVCDLEKSYSEAGNPMWVWWFRIHSGDFKNRRFPVYTALTPAAMWKVRETLVALGLGEGGKQAKFKKEEAIGRTCIITVVDDEYRGQKRSSIQNISCPPPGAPERVTVAPSGDTPF